MKKLLGRSVYSNALAIFLLASIVLFGVLIALTQGIILREYSGTEQREMVSRLQRLNSLLLREVRPLDKAVMVASRNPETLRFLRGEPNSLTPDNLLTTLLPLGTSADFLVISSLDEQGMITQLREEAVELKLGNFSTMLSQVFNDEPLDGPTDSEVRSGFVLINTLLVAISFSAVGDPADPIGFVICGKLLDRDALSYLEGIFSAHIEFNPFRNLEVSAPGNEHILRMLTTNDVAVVTDSANTLSGYMFLRSPSGIPLGLLRFSQQQTLLDKGKSASQLFLLGVALTGGALVFVVWVLLDRTILRRIRNLTQKLESEKKSGRLPVRLDFGGEDELSELATSIEDLAQLLESAQFQYRNVVEDQTEMICRFSGDFRVTFANEAFRKVFRREGSDLAEARMGELLDLKNQREFENHYTLLCPERPISTFVHRLETSATPARWLRTTLRKNFAEDGSITGGQWVSSDITAQIEAQLQTLESERRFRRLFETASDGILLVEGREFKISDLNPSLTRMLELDPPQVLGAELREVPSFRACLRLLRRFEANETQAPELNRVQTRLQKADGSRLFVELSCTSYSWQNERFFQFNFHDVTERVEGEEELRQLSSRLLKSQDDERRKIARDLHDSTAQNLSALEMNLTLLESGLTSTDARNRRLLEETRRLSTDCSKEIRNISYLLHPPLIDEVGLAFAVKWFATGFSQRTGIGVNVTIGENVPRLPSQVEMPLFRIIQEALTNIYRHSAANQAEIALTRDTEEMICLSIVDNGRGFPADTPVDSDDEPIPTGVGLAGMRERTVELGGQFNLESSPDGVSIIIIIPLGHD